MANIYHKILMCMNFSLFDFTLYMDRERLFKGFLNEWDKLTNLKKKKFFSIDWLNHVSQ